MAAKIWDPAAAMGVKRVTLSDLLDAGLSLPPERRLAWVEQLGAEHAELKPRLRALLARSTEDVESPVLETLPKLDERELARFDVKGHAAGDEIGPYRLTRQLGVGAMGVVWLAGR